jgi:hypothetical protein
VAQQPQVQGAEPLVPLGNMIKATCSVVDGLQFTLIVGFFLEVLLVP